MAYEIIVRSRRDGEKPSVTERRSQILYHSLVAANDNGLVWSLVPVFDGFFGA
jgi:hypothetical protein